MRTLLCISFLLFSAFLNAQEYKPLVVEGAWWAYYEIWDDGFGNITSYYYVDTFEKDTTINNVSYLVLTSGYMYREEDKKVFMKVNDEEWLVCDFNYGIGEQMEPLNYIIEDIVDYELLDGSIVPTSIFEGLPSSIPYCGSNYCVSNGFGLTQRIGNFATGLVYPYGLEPQLDFGITLYGFGFGDQLLYSRYVDVQSKEELLNWMQVNNKDVNNTLVNLSPNPTNHNLNINSQLEVKKVTIFNVNGQKVSQAHNTKQLNVSTLKAGRYIAQIELLDGSISSQHFVKQ